MLALLPIPYLLSSTNFTGQIMCLDSHCKSMSLYKLYTKIQKRIDISNQIEIRKGNRNLKKPNISVRTKKRLQKLVLEMDMALNLDKGGEE